jgi:uncharacterized protein YeaO (DUF488 family)
MTKGDVDFDEWCKEVAPSTELRKWYGHDPERFEEFERRYKTELTQPERAKVLGHLHDLMRQRTLTLLTATKQPQISEASVLAALNRPGFPGDSKPWKGWSHGEQDNLEAVSA